MDSRNSDVSQMAQKILEAEVNAMPVRILHVVTYMGRGGLETMLMNYYRNMDRDKIQFDFLTHRSSEADYDQEILSLGGRIYHLPRLNPWSPAYLKALDHFFQEHKEYKIVHSHLDCMAGIPLKYAKKNGVPLCIAHAHNSSQVKDKKYLLKLWFRRTIPNYSHARFACSKAAGDWMYRGADYDLLSNAIDAEKYVWNPEVGKCIRHQLGIPETALVVGEVARISPQKNHSFLIDIFAELLKLHEHAVLLLVGDGPLAEQMKEKVRNLGLEKKVHFTGVRKDVPDLLQAMDVFVMPSLFEGLPVVMVEAQAAGLPCLISDRVPGECEKTKGLVRQIPLTDSAAAWAEAILQAGKCERKNTYAEIVAAEFDIKENARRLQEYYLKQ